MIFFFLFFCFEYQRLVIGLWMTGLWEVEKDEEYKYDFEESREFGTLNMLIGRSLLSGFVNIELTLLQKFLALHATIFGQSDKTLEMKKSKEEYFFFPSSSFIVLFYFYYQMTNMSLNKRSREEYMQNSVSFWMEVFNLSQSATIFKFRKVNK